ncbi:MAG TPA: hypothetical protein DCX79_15790 [Planctomycetaceae bacterium]|nr:hypothetical protein [Planctomycetaceae bacterium]
MRIQKLNLAVQWQSAGLSQHSRQFSAERLVQIWRPVMKHHIGSLLQMDPLRQDPRKCQLLKNVQ